jgi:hypothetical protein
MRLVVPGLPYLAVNQKARYKSSGSEYGCKTPRALAIFFTNHSSAFKAGFNSSRPNYLPVEGPSPVFLLPGIILIHGGYDRC